MTGNGDVFSRAAVVITLMRVLTWASFILAALVAVIGAHDWYMDKISVQGLQWRLVIAVSLAATGISTFVIAVLVELLKDICDSLTAARNKS